MRRQWRSVRGLAFPAVVEGRSFGMTWFFPPQHLDYNCLEKECGFIFNVISQDLSSRALLCRQSFVSCVASALRPQQQAQDWLFGRSFPTSPPWGKLGRLPSSLRIICFPSKVAVGRQPVSRLKAVLEGKIWLVSMLYLPGMRLDPPCSMLPVVCGPRDGTACFMATLCLHLT